ncbi:hypothetical protein LCGC14_0905420 [marine sediment metagenome]|uniref:Uncharacterized protein n=1 Tax=marine sediment metagenome TaxID=412755 RepID=A0A0F9NV84_9ZZZZ
MINGCIDMDFTIYDIIELAVILDSINWKQLILENHCDRSRFALLENFRKNQ